MLHPAKCSQHSSYTQVSYYIKLGERSPQMPIVLLPHPGVDMMPSCKLLFKDKAQLTQKSFKKTPSQSVARVLNVAAPCYVNLSSSSQCQEARLLCRSEILEKKNTLLGIQWAATRTDSPACNL